MKTRQGFVSNSSSSSFLIYGVCLGYDLSREKLEQIESKLGDEFEVIGPPDGCSYAGESWDSMGEDETKAQFKERVGSRLKELLGPDIKLDTHEESWYDG